MMHYYIRDLTNSQICLILLVCTVPSAVFLAAIAGFTPRTKSHGDRSGTVVKVLCYKSEGRWFDPSFIDINSFRSHYEPGVDWASNRNEYKEHFLGVKAVGA